MRDFYKILGVGKDADDDELKKAYKRNAVKYHPDKQINKSETERASAEEKFKDVAEAFETLSDKNKRAVYDRYGEEGLKARSGSADGMGEMPASGVPAGFPGGVHFSFSTNGGGGMDAARAQALFESLFSGGIGGMGGGGRMGDGQTSGGFFDHHAMDPFASLMGGMGGMGGLRCDGRGAAKGVRRSRTSDAGAGRVDHLTPGTLVVIEGLSLQAQHNGALGRIEAHDASRGRYVVALQDGTSLAVRPENAHQVISDATVVGTSQTALNGKQCAGAVYDHASKRYRCQGLKPDGTVLSLKPENVLLPRQTRVRIEGIESRPQLNGQMGAVTAVDMATGRYQVDLRDGEAIKVKFGAVAAC